MDNCAGVATPPTAPLLLHSMMHLLLLLLPLALALEVTSPCALEVTTEDNLMATKLPGNWTHDPILSHHLGGLDNSPLHEVTSTSLVHTMLQVLLTFSPDPRVLAQVPQDHCRFPISSSSLPSIPGSSPITRCPSTWQGTSP